MASQSILKELYNESLKSSLFQGMKPESVWEACLEFKDRSDEDIRIAIENMHKKDSEKLDESESKQQALAEAKKKMVEMKEKESADRMEDGREAEKVLEELMNM